MFAGGTIEGIANGFVWLLAKFWALFDPWGCGGKAAAGKFTGGGIGGNERVWFMAAACWAGLLGAFDTLYELSFWGLALTVGPEAFWRDMLARASKIEEAAGARAGAVGCCNPSVLWRSGGGLPSGVVEWSGSMEMQS
jgi:hypothetical protein